MFKFGILYVVIYMPLAAFSRQSVIVLAQKGSSIYGIL